jgi:hypothetical protein
LEGVAGLVFNVAVAKRFAHARPSNFSDADGYSSGTYVGFKIPEPSEIINQLR